MAKVTNAFDTYTATSDRESLSDVIYNISPSTTPFMSSIGKSNVKNVQFDWQTEALPTASGTGELEVLNFLVQLLLQLLEKVTFVKSAAEMRL